MQERNILLCFLAVPLRHKLIAAVIAVAIGSGFFVWSRHGASRLATTAELWLDAGEARQSAPGVMQAKEPAVALAQSILNDDAISGLAKRTGVKDNAAQFRSRLALTQPSPNLLHVDYRNSDQQLSVAMANAVANMLTAWTPPPALATPAPAFMAPVPVLAEHPAPKPHRSLRSSHKHPDDISKLEAQLAATDQRLAALSAAPPPATAPAKADASTRPSSKESDQQRSLEAQLSAAQKDLADLRERYTDEYPDVETAKENVAGIERELASLRPISSDGVQAANTPKREATDEASQLRQERAHLVEEIEVQRRAELPRDQASLTTTNSTAPAQAALVARSQPALVRPPANTVAGPVLQSPFTLVRMASYSEPGSWWHGVLAGILCGFLYLSSAVWKYLPIQSGAARDLATEEEARHADSSNDFASWEQEIKRAISLTDIGRQEEALDAQQQIGDSSSASKGQLHYHEVSEAIRQKISREPNSWMAHTEGARVALAAGDLETAFKKIKLAMSVAPEKLKPQLDRIVVQLNKNAAIHK